MVVTVPGVMRLHRHAADRIAHGILGGSMAVTLLVVLYVAASVVMLMVGVVMRHGSALATYTR